MHINKERILISTCPLVCWDGMKKRDNSVVVVQLNFMFKIYYANCIHKLGIYEWNHILHVQSINEHYHSFFATIVWDPEFSKQCYWSWIFSHYFWMKLLNTDALIIRTKRIRRLMIDVNIFARSVWEGKKAVKTITKVINSVLMKFYCMNRSWLSWDERRLAQFFILYNNLHTCISDWAWN